METPTIKFFKLDERAKIPTRAHPTDSGMDICAIDDITIFESEVVTVKTGIGAIIPKGYELQIRPRSGLSSRGIWAAFGTVDEGYRGEIKVVVANVSLSEIEVNKYRIHAGDRIAQLVLVPVVRPSIEEVEKPTDETDRRENGFGSTGK